MPAIDNAGGQDCEGESAVDIKNIVPGFSVGGQITVADVSHLADQGFRTILVNRPDGEEAGQPDHATIADAARQYGIELRYIPIRPGEINDNAGAAMGAAIRTMPGPLFAYCRSGMRSATLWAMSQALSQAEEASVEAILGAAAAAGYDLSALATYLKRHGKKEAKI